MIYARVVLLMFGALAAVAVPLEAATATWDRNPEASVTGYRLSYGTQSNNHTTSIDVGNVTTYQFFPPVGQRYYVVVQAYNSSGLSGKSAEVVLDLTGSPPPPPPNQVPVLTQPANQSSVQNTAVSLTLTASDPEGNAITYGAIGLPPGLTVNASTGVISGTVTTVGVYTVTASAWDGAQGATRTFTWTVTASAGGATTITLSPVDTTLELQNDSRSTWTRLAAYTYPANQVGKAILMKFDLSQIPANATIQSAALQLTLIATDNVTTEPNYGITLHRVTNANADPSSATGWVAASDRMWTANNCCQNNIPMAQADIAAAQATTNVDRTLGPKTWDATSLVQAWRSAPATNYGLLLNADKTKGTDRYREFASMESYVAGERPFLRVTYSVPVTGGGGDTTAPTVALSAPANNSTVSGTAVAVSATASDAVGVVGVQFKIDGVNIGAEDTTSPYSIAWNSTSTPNGSHQLTAVARDAAGNSTTSAARSVTVSNTTANRAPILTQPANQTSAEGAAVSVALSASDPDGNALTFSATGLPNGLTINPTTGLISGAPSYTSAGTASVTATASDGALSHSRTFSWIVTNTNRVPVLTQPANQTSATGSSVSLQLSASDPDGTALTYSATGLPAGLAINASTGLISGTLGASSAGVRTVTATASDGALSSSRTFTWSVESGDTPVAGDFDGDSQSDPATFRRSSGEWRVWRSASNYAAAAPVVWGVSTDIPVPADYDGDGRTDFAVYRPSTGTWHVLLSSTNMQTDLEIQWGTATDRPLPLDYDRDGRADLALPRFGGFEILLSGSNYTNSVTVR